MTPERDDLSPEQQDQLAKVRARVLTRGASEPLTDDTFSRIAQTAWDRADAAEAHERHILRVVNLPMSDDEDRRVKREIRWAKKRMTREQRQQWNIWFLANGWQRRRSFRLTVTWHVPPHWEPIMSDRQTSEKTCQWLVPLIAEALEVPDVCLGDPQVSWVVAGDPRKQGITIVLIREV